MSASRYRAKGGASFGARVIARKGLLYTVELENYWRFRCFDRHGALKWEEEVANLIVNAGLTYLLGAGLLGTSPITTWYIGLVADNPTFAAADTMGSHAGWTEYTAYAGSSRPTWSGVAGAAGEADNSASPASFALNADGVIAGGFLTSVVTKGGTTGTLYAEAAFDGGDRDLDNGDSLLVEAAATIVSA